MSLPVDRFDARIREQIAINLARTPTERFLAMCELIDAIRAMAPKDAAAQERRRRVAAARERDRERMREHFRRLAAAHRANDSDSV
jgi:hypothetical protein